MDYPTSASPALTRFSILVTEASQILGVEPKVIYDVLSVSGIDDTEEGVKLLNSPIITEEDLTESMSDIKAPKLKMKAAVSTLKGYNPYKEEGTRSIGDYDTLKAGSTCTGELSVPGGLESIPKLIAKGILESLPERQVDFKQLKDKDLLELYTIEKDYEIMMELSRRAKHQYWVVLKEDKSIDIETSLELLKRARRMVNPSMVPVGDSIVPVYRITEINPDDNIIEICPICGDVLYKDYCGSCESNFAGIGKEERAYINLIVTKSGNFKEDSYSDKKAILASANKGMDDLRVTWPSIQKLYDDLDMIDSLPKLRKVRTLPSVVKPSDSFNVFQGFIFETSNSK